MPLVKAQCTNCGGVLDVDSSGDAALCPFCNTPYVIEKAINLFQNNFNITVESVKPEQILKNAYILLQNGDKDGAKKLLDDYKRHYPEDWRLWFAYAYSEIDEELFIENIERAIKHSSNNDNFLRMLDLQKQCLNMKQEQEKLRTDIDNCRVEQANTYETMGKDPAILDADTIRKLTANKTSGIVALSILAFILIVCFINKVFWAICPWMMFFIPILIWTIIPIDKLSTHKYKLNQRETTKQKFEDQISDMDKQIYDLDDRRKDLDNECRDIGRDVLDEVLSTDV